MSSKNIVFARLAYPRSWNLGDMIQSLATEQFLGNDFINIARSELDQYSGPKAILLMQGYFFINEYYCSFPPSENIIPVFFGFHIEDSIKTREVYSSKEYVDYLKKHEPIGCRDISTKIFLEKSGIKAFFSRCLTLTFPLRDASIKRETIFFIDEPEWLTPNKYYGNKFNKLYKEGVFLSQIIDENSVNFSDKEKRQMAIDRLELLKDKAKLVITSRLHIAAPCIAMGIPVVLIPRTQTPSRYEAIKGLIPIYFTPTKSYHFFGKCGTKLTFFIRILFVRFFIDWNPKAPNIETLKKSMIAKLANTINKCTAIL
jgi:Polysaccharide pyruvyl transferase.